MRQIGQRAERASFRPRSTGFRGHFPRLNRLSGRRPAERSIKDGHHYRQQRRALPRQLPRGLRYSRNIGRVTLRWPCVSTRGREAQSAVGVRPTNQSTMGGAATIHSLVLGSQHTTDERRKALMTSRTAAQLADLLHLLSRADSNDFRRHRQTVIECKLPLKTL